MFLKEILEDGFAIIFSFLYVLLIVGLAKKLNDAGVSSKLLRELTHVSMGVWPILWFMFKHRISGFIVPLIVTIMLSLAPEKLRRVFSREDEKHIGLVFYAFSFTIITFFFWKNFAGAAAIFCLGFGDGLGGLIGSRYGKHKYKIPWVKEKSLEGSATIFIVSMVSIILAQILFPPPTGFNLLIAVIGATAVTLIEAISPYHSDNLTIPLITAPMLLVAMTVI